VVEGALFEHDTALHLTLLRVKKGREGWVGGPQRESEGSPGPKRVLKEKFPPLWLGGGKLNFDTSGPMFHLSNLRVIRRDRSTEGCGPKEGKQKDSADPRGGEQCQYEPTTLYSWMRKKNKTMMLLRARGEKGIFPFSPRGWNISKGDKATRSLLKNVQTTGKTEKDHRVSSLGGQFFKSAGKRRERLVQETVVHKDHSRRKNAIGGCARHTKSHSLADNCVKEMLEHDSGHKRGRRNTGRCLPFPHGGQQDAPAQPAPKSLSPKKKRSKRERDRGKREESGASE